MPHHDLTEFPENPCGTGECVWDNIGGQRIEWCTECMDKIRTRLLAALNRCCYDLDEGHPPGRHVRSRKENVSRND